MGTAERPLPVRPSLNALLAQRTAPRHVRRALAEAVVAAVQAHPPRLFPKYVSWALVMTTDPPRPERRKKGTIDMSGRVIDENDLTPEQRARRTAAVNGTMTPEQAELAERKAARAQQADAGRARWLESSGFGAVIEKAEGLLADLPRAHEEHQRAQRAGADLVDFLALAAEVPDDPVLQRFARCAAELRQSISRPPLLAENAGALRELIAKVRGADLEGVNGARNPNVIEAWKRRFRELLSPLPPAGHAAECARQVKAFLVEARAARETGR